MDARKESEKASELIQKAIRVRIRLNRAREQLHEALNEAARITEEIRWDRYFHYDENALSFYQNLDKREGDDRPHH